MKKEEFRTTQQKELLNFLDSEDKSAVLINNAPAGAGKTTITSQEVADLDELYTYLGASHKLLDEHHDNPNLGFNALLVAGRQRWCSDKIGKSLFALGINPKRIWCKFECPNKEQCRCEQVWRKLENNPDSWMGPHAFLGNAANIFVRKHEGWGTVIVDENPIDSLKKEYKFRPEDLTQNIHFLQQQNDSGELTFICKLAENMLESIRTGQLAFEKLKKSVEEFGMGCTDSGLDQFNENIEQTLFDLFNEGKKIRNIITPLVRYAKHLIQNRDEPDYYKEVFRLVNGKKFTYVDAMYFDRTALDLACKVLILDGTTPKEFYDKMLPSRTVKQMFTEAEVANSLPNTKMFQLTDHKYAQSTLQNNDKTLHKFLHIVELVAKLHNEPVVVFARGCFEDWLKKINPDLITVTKFNSRGTNDFRDHRVAVLFGDPDQSHDVVNRMSTLLRCEKDEYLHLVREEEMTQDCYRTNIRENYDAPVHLYVLTNVPFDIGVAEDKKTPLKLDLLERSLEAKILLRDAFRNVSSLRYTEAVAIIKPLKTRDISPNTLIHQLIKEQFVRYGGEGKSINLYPAD